MAACFPIRTDLVLDALRMVLAQREPGADFELVAHTDRGSQYTSANYSRELDDHGVLASVGSVGDAYDCDDGSFVDTFKTDLIADRDWRFRSQLGLAVAEYIAWFNNDRYTNPSAMSHPLSSSLSTVQRGVDRSSSNEGWIQLKRSP